MFNKDKLQAELDKRNWSRYKLSKMAGVSQSTIRDIFGPRAVTPSTRTLSKIVAALDIPISVLFDEEYSQCDTGDTSEGVIKEESETYKAHEFKNAHEAMEYILKQPAIMGFGGLNANTLTEEDIIQLANELLTQYENLSYKYKYKNKK